MKRSIIIMLTIVFCISATAQQLTKEDYLRKSKNQKTTAWIFTGGGGAMIIAGLVLVTHGDSNRSYFPYEQVGTALLVAGGAAVIPGVIFFSASNRNKKKADEVVAFHLNFEKAVLMQNASLRNNYYPALSVNIRLK